MPTCSEANGDPLYPRIDSNMKSMKFIGMEPKFEFYHNLFREMFVRLPDNFECYYVWSWQDNWETFSNIKFREPNVLVFITDILAWDELEYWNDEAPKGLQVLLKTAQKNKHITFYIASESLGIENYTKGVGNIKVLIDVVPTLMGEIYLWRDKKIEIKKNMDSMITTVALTRRVCYARTNLLSYIFGKGIDKNTRISYNVNSLKEFESWSDYCSWRLNKITDEQREKLINGFSCLKRYNGTNLKFYEEYDELIDYNRIQSEQGGMITHHTINFDKNLSKIYENSFVELISETTYVEKINSSQEKSYLPIIAMNFPIWLTAPGTVKYFREFVEFDVFDDVIDHSYDDIEDPAERLVTAIDRNERILKDPNYAKGLWEKHSHRFGKNLNIWMYGIEQKHRKLLDRAIEEIWQNQNL